MVMMKIKMRYMQMKTQVVMIMLLIMMIANNINPHISEKKEDKPQGYKGN